MSVKEKIDTELQMITFTPQMEEKVKASVGKSQWPAWHLIKIASIVLAIFLLSGVGVAAGRVFWGQTNVNEKTLPDLDNMKMIENQDITKRMFDSEFFNGSYKLAQKDLGVPLLDSELAVENPYMYVWLETDYKDYCSIHVSNYILGDTSNYELVYEASGSYNCDPGEEYYSPIKLEVDLILSQEQYDTGWNVDYLGYYEFVESYVSTQGYKVNLIQDTTYKEMDGNHMDSDIKSEKCAIFVADGIRYTLSGRTSMETIKGIVDGMKLVE